MKRFAFALALVASVAACTKAEQAEQQPAQTPAGDTTMVVDSARQADSMMAGDTAKKQP